MHELTKSAPAVPCTHNAPTLQRNYQSRSLHFLFSFFTSLSSSARAFSRPLPVPSTRARQFREAVCVASLAQRAKDACARGRACASYVGIYICIYTRAFHVTKLANWLCSLSSSGRVRQSGKSIYVQRERRKLDFAPARTRGILL